MKYQYIQDMINARIKGTAIHLDINTENEEVSLISYKKHRIWGLKTLIKDLIEDIFNIFYRSLPNNGKLVNPEEDLLTPIEELCNRYNVSLKNVRKLIDERKEPKRIWETLDVEQQALFIINAFFDAFEENLIDSYFISASFWKFTFIKFKLKPTLKRADFGLKDFGFVFRARGYSYVFSKNIYNNAFTNTIKRLNKLLYQEYKETFLEKTQSKDKVKEGKVELEALPEEKKYVIEMLRNGNSQEKLEAIRLIVENKILEAVNDLEYFLNNKDESVMNAAFDAVVSLKSLM